MNQPASSRHLPPAPLNAALKRLFRRMLDEMDQRESSEWDGREGHVDVADYSDPAHLVSEISHVLRRLPLCLGHADQLREPGSMIARDIFGMPLLLVRDREGDIQVLLNVCRHRGTRLVLGENEVCRRATLTCPYHAWTYDLKGQLRNIPAEAGFPNTERASHGLKRLPSEVRHGLIWAVLDPAATDIAVGSFLGELDDDITTLGLASHRFFRQHARRCPTNWKLMMDAFQEVYHIKSLHQRTIAPFFLDMKTAGEGVGRHTRILVGRDKLPQARELPEDAWDVRRHATLTHAIFPNSLLIYHPDATSHMAMFPITPDEMLFVHTFFTPHEPRDEDEKEHWNRTFEMIDAGVFTAEDLFVSEQIQLGLKSGANQQFVFGRFEQHLRRYHDNLADMLRAAAAQD
jgi:phenylpropionate dioxygenase-like ring-hydroxylating dioxygenase large terminal subunit